MEKLVLAEDTSNIDDTDISSQELRERDKKRRRMKAKKKFSSSSSDDEFSGSENKENNSTQLKTLPAYPAIDSYVSVVNGQMDKQPLTDASMEQCIEI